jgi:hypothetical protein
MAALLRPDDLRRHAVPVLPFDVRPPRPVASWQFDQTGRLICVWSMSDIAPGAAPS